MSSRSVAREAHAKLNVFLRVLGLREDGYHELESLVLPISLADTVLVEDATRLEVEVHGDPAMAAGATDGGMNLGWLRRSPSPSPAASPAAPGSAS